MRYVKQHILTSNKFFLPLPPKCESGAVLTTDWEDEQWNLCMEDRHIRSKSVLSATAERYCLKQFVHSTEVVHSFRGSTVSIARNRVTWALANSPSFCFSSDFSCSMTEAEAEAEEVLKWRPSMRDTLPLLPSLAVSCTSDFSRISLCCRMRERERERRKKERGKEGENKRERGREGEKKREREREREREGVLVVPTHIYM